MNERPLLDPTVDLPPSDDNLDAALAAAFGPDSGPPLSAGGSVLKALSARLPSVPRILLREPDSFGGSPIVRPSSEEMPDKQDPAGRLQLHGEIARGGMGAVLKGRDMDLGRDLAVKVLLETHQGKSEMLQRFIEEAQISGQLQHPGIAPVYELGQFVDKRPYFTMKLVKGKTLATLLAARKSQEEERTRYVGIFTQICQTLAYAHARGVIHRDLKPSNVMVGAFGEVQVMDWGLAKVLKEGGIADELKAQQRAEVSVIRTQRSEGSSTPEAGSHTQAGTVLGTPAYMAPEQARGEVDLVDERADVFGLGAILCVILTGQPPYVSKGEEIAYKARNAKLDDAFARLDECGADAELIGLAKHCLAAEKWERPRHAGEVAEQVTAYQQSVTDRLRQAELARSAEEARAIEAQATAAQERRARRLTLALAASVLLTMLLGGGGWLWLRGQREARLTANNRAVEQALRQATMLRGQARTAQGRAAADWAMQAREQARRAEALVEREAADSALVEHVQVLLTELNADEKDRQFLAALDAARRAQTDADKKEYRYPLERAVPLYREAFRAYGLTPGQEEAASVAARLAERPAPVREAILAALDEWVSMADTWPNKVNEPHLPWLQAVLKAAEMEGWVKQVREVWADKDKARRRARLEKMAESADPRLPAQSLIVLVRRLRVIKADASALSLLRRAQLRHVGDFWINEELGLALLEKRPAEAVRYLAAAAALRPDNIIVHSSLAQALAGQSRWDEAVAELRLALDLEPDDPHIYNHLGIALDGQGKQDEAVAAYNKAIAGDPKSAKPHYNLARLLKKQRKWNEAIVECRKAIQLDPTDALAHCILGSILFNQGKWDDALVEYREAIRLNPNDADRCYDLGAVLAKQGKHEEAIAAYNNAIKIDPDHALSHFGLGHVLNEQHKWDEAIVELGKAIHCDEKLAVAHSELGSALLNRAKHDEADFEYRKALEIDPKNAVAHGGLGMILANRGRLEEALTAFAKSIELDPESADAHYNLGSALMQQGNLAQASTEFRETIRLQFKYWEAHLNLGLALLGLGDDEGGLLEVRKAIDLAPDQPLPRCNLGFVLLNLGRFPEAVEAMKRGHAQRSNQPGWPYPSALWLKQVEQTAALASKFPAYLRGEYQARDAAERLRLMQICRGTKNYASAARLYADAFAADAKLAANLREEHRFHAARVAALAGCGRGEDKKKLDEKERLHWRKQALDWLRDELDVYGKLAMSGRATDRRFVQKCLYRWQQHHDLVGIRDKDAVAKLPVGERQACEKLWADVATLLKKIEQKR